MRHGMSATRLYRAWDSMKARCYRPTTDPYKKYGAKGITVCEEWRNSFIAFRDWALSNGYKDGLSLDRIDYTGNYEPSNCRWVTIKDQQNNKSSNKLVEFKGCVLTIAEWSYILEIPQHVLQHRFARGWSVARALTTEVREYKRKGK